MCGMEKSKAVRICVLQHFPCQLPSCFDNRQVYIPLQCGRSCRELIPETIGDDTGDNISNRNADVNEMTAIYWVARHYNELGNPDYIGFDHYRRFLEWTSDMLAPHTVVAHRWFSWRTLRGQFACCHGGKDLDVFDHRIRDVMPVLEHALYDAYWRSHFLYLANCFIMSREDFFRYFEFMKSCMEVVFSIIDSDVIDRSSYSSAMKRIYGFILERMTGYWIWREYRRRTIRVRHTRMIHYEIDNTVNGTRCSSHGFLSFLRQPR